MRTLEKERVEQEEVFTEINREDGNHREEVNRVAGKNKTKEPLN